MRSSREVLVYGVLVGVLAAGIGAGALFGYVSWYARTDRIFPGVVVGHTPVGGLRVSEARPRVSGVGLARGAAAGLAPTLLRLRWEGREWPLDAAAVPDVSGALRVAAAVGRSGSAGDRVRTYLGGLVHGHYVPLEGRTGDDVILGQLQAIAPRMGEGRVLDVPASVAAIRRAILAARPEVDLVVHTVEPEVRQPETRQPVAQTPEYAIARFTTPVLAADTGRVHNITTAVKKINGVVIAPGQTFSFNETVGPRDAAHGWAPAKELYQGEFVMGYGGGICQVSSTLYNAVLLGGLEVRERFHHDRPLQYVAPGRDATVVWDVLDFKFRNSAAVPVVLEARLIPGAPAQIEVALRAPTQAPQGLIRIEDAEIRYYPPPMEEVLDSVLPATAREVIDEGLYGIELKVFRVFRGADGERRELVSHDHYRPKPGRVRVGVGNAPGTQRLLNPGLR